MGLQGLLFCWVRQAFQGSVYAVAAVLASFLGGLGLGALGAALLRRKWRAETVLVIGALMAALVVTAFALNGERWVAAVPELTRRSPSGILVECLAWALPVLLPLTVAVGVVFPAAWELVWPRVRRQGAAIGAAVAANKLAAAAGAAAGPFLLLPLWGLRGATAAIGMGYAVLGVWAAIKVGNRWGRLGCGLCGVLVLGLGAVGVSSKGLNLGHAEGDTLLQAYAGPYGLVSVVETSAGSRQIVTNTKQRLSGTQRALSSQRHQSWVPLLLCERPRRVLTIGMAAGISASAALDGPVEELVSVELVPEVARAARTHFGRWNGPLFADARSRVVVDDGRRFLRLSGGRYDCVIGDLFFPADEGTAGLYSREFFGEVRDHLALQGIFCLWLPVYQHDAESAGVVVRTFLEVFPHALMVRANLDPMQPVVGLVGSMEPLRVGREALAERLAQPWCQKVARESVFFSSVGRAWGLIVGDLRAAEPGFGGGLSTSDDAPVFAYLGARRVAPGERLVGMVFLNWSGRRFLQPSYPSCDLGDTGGEEVLRHVRAGNYVFAAAVADSSIPGDTRSPEQRVRAVRGYVQQASRLAPEAVGLADGMGR